MKKRKSRTLTFFYSFLPGAAEMYMGLMKMGSSLMAVFFLGFLVPMILHFNDFFVLIPALIWFYGFFHARNIAALDDAEFENLQDTYIWTEFTGEHKISIPKKNMRMWIAGILIVFGLATLWGNLEKIIYPLIPEQVWDEVYPIVHSIPESIVAVLCIVVGIRLIIGKKEEIDGEGK